MTDEQKAAIEAGVLEALKELGIEVPSQTPETDPVEPTETPTENEEGTETPVEPTEADVGTDPVEPTETDPVEPTEADPVEPTETPTEPSVVQPVDVTQVVQDYLEQHKISQTKVADKFDSTLDSVANNLADPNGDLSLETKKLLEFMILNYGAINSAAERLLSE